MDFRYQRDVPEQERKKGIFGPENPFWLLIFE